MIKRQPLSGSQMTNNGNSSSTSKGKSRSRAPTQSRASQALDPPTSFETELNYLSKIEISRAMDTTFRDVRRWWTDPEDLTGDNNLSAFK
eukprot:gene19784-6932_t